jgi:phenylacetate-CoA ligase
MRDAGATVLCCTPTYSLRLAEAAQESNFDLSTINIKKIIVAGEPGAGLSSTRNRIESAWNGARLYDHHGMTETGPVSYETTANPGYLHADESAFFVEVLNPETNAPVKEGETGELILTTLGRVGMPLIRYRTNDLVKPDWSGKQKFTVDDVAFEGGIIGRRDDMVIVRGVNLFPTAVEDIIRSFNDVAEYQVKIYEELSLTQVTLEIEASEHCQDAESLAKSIENTMREAFHLRVPVMIVPSGSLPRYEMKAKRWLRM